MPQVVAMESGPQGRASQSWDILAREPSQPELGERKTQPVEASSEQPSEPSEPETKELVQPEVAGEQEPSQQEQEGEQKSKLSRYERTKRQRKAFETERASFEAQRKAFSEERRALDEAKRKAAEPPYTVAELKQYRKIWNEPTHKDYDPGLVEKADAEIQRLEKLEAESSEAFRIPKSGTPEFIQQWQAAETELYNLDSEFQRENTRLDKVLRTMMSGPDGNLYRQHPRGIVAAYHRARLDIATADLGTARAENQKLKTEVARLNGLLGIGPGVNGGRSIGEFRGKDFSNLSTKEMREHLKRNAIREHW